MFTNFTVVALQPYFKICGKSENAWPVHEIERGLNNSIPFHFIFEIAVMPDGWK